MSSKTAVARHSPGTALTICSGRIAKPTFSGSGHKVWPSFSSVKSIKCQLTGIKQTTGILLLGIPLLFFLLPHVKYCRCRHNKLGKQVDTKQTLAIQSQCWKPGGDANVFTGCAKTCGCYTDLYILFVILTGLVTSEAIQKDFSQKHTESCRHDGFSPYLYSF